MQVFREVRRRGDQDLASGIKLDPADFGRGFAGREALGLIPAVAKSGIDVIWKSGGTCEGGVMTLGQP